MTGHDLAHAYSTGFYSPATPVGGKAIGFARAINNRLRLRELGGLRPGRLLDIGCGKGHFLAAARELGWEVSGIDSSESAAASARQLYGLQILVGDVADEAIPGAPFDAITMWHVLEHVPDPTLVVARARELLRPGGRLVVSVPNVASLQARVFGRHWFHLDRQRHVFHFTPRALRTLLERHGFSVDRMGYLAPEMEAIGLVQSTLNRLGFEPDRLYRVVKGDPAVAVDGPTIGSVLLAAAVFPAAIAWSAIAPVLRSGASMQVVAHLELPDQVTSVASGCGSAAARRASA